MQATLLPTVWFLCLGPCVTKIDGPEKEEIIAFIGENHLCLLSEWVKQLVCCWDGYMAPMGRWLGYCRLQEASLALSAPRSGIRRSVWTQDPIRSMQPRVCHLDFCLGLHPSGPQLVSERRMVGMDGCLANASADTQQIATPRLGTRVGTQRLQSASMRPSRGASVTHRSLASGQAHSSST